MPLSPDPSGKFALKKKTALKSGATCTSLTHRNPSLRSGVSSPALQSGFSTKVRNISYLGFAFLLPEGTREVVQKIPEGKEDYHRQFRGRVSKIVFRNIHVIDGTLPFSVFHGFDAEHNIDGVLIENLTYQGRRLTDLNSAKIRLHHTENLVIK